MAFTLQEALNLLESGDWCALRVIQANIVKGSGGKVLELQQCRIARRQPATEATGRKSAASHTKKRDANHNYHFTRNVELPNKRIITIHPILITNINQQPVI